LLCAPCPAKYLPKADIIEKLIVAGMRVVVHGLVDWRVHEKLGTNKVKAPFVIRPALTSIRPGALFIPHPYVRAGKLPTDNIRYYHAISIARTTFIKNTLEIVRANTMLPRDKQVALMGTVDRMYVQHKIKREHPQFIQHNTGFPPAWDLGALACNDALYAIDMSDGSTNGGGGTQYTFLEAWDGGAINVLNRDWFNDPGSMKNGVNCLAAGNGGELAALLRQRPPDNRQKIIEAGHRQLKKHDAATVAAEYWEHLKRG
jgi:hypothetical protein